MFETLRSTPVSVKISGADCVWAAMGARSASAAVVVSKFFIRFYSFSRRRSWIDRFAGRIHWAYLSNKVAAVALAVAVADELPVFGSWQGPVMLLHITIIRA